MRVLVVGGTGTVGRHVVASLVRRGIDVRVLSRSGAPGQGAAGQGAAGQGAAGLGSTGRAAPDGTGQAFSAPGAAIFFAGDVRTGAGLAEAMDSVDVVVDCSNVVTMSGRKATAFFTTGTARLRMAERTAEVAHHVLLSIVGIDDVPYPYYQAKLAQERVAATGLPPCTILRSTQFMEFGAQVAAKGTVGPVVLVPDWPVQPVAAVDVGEALADVAEAPPAGRAMSIGGPGVLRLPELVRMVLAARGTPRRVASVPYPGKVGRAIARGGILLRGGRRGTTTLEEYLDGLRDEA